MCCLGLRARMHGLTVAKDDALKKGDQALTQKIGEVVLNNDLVRAMVRPSPLARGTSDERGRRDRLLLPMSAVLSASKLRTLG